MNENDGGPAFPVSDGSGRVTFTEPFPLSGGMSLRDYFAAKALSIVMQSSDIQDVLSWAAWTSKVAKVAYEVADAMMEARSK